MDIIVAAYLEFNPPYSMEFKNRFRGLFIYILIGAIKATDQLANDTFDADFVEE